MGGCECAAARSFRFGKMPSILALPASVATVLLSSAQLGFTDFGRDTASKAELSGVPGDWLYVTWLD
jgi:hypothetical protein